MDGVHPGEGLGYCVHARKHQAAQSSALAHLVEESTQHLRASEMKAVMNFRRLYVSNMAFGFESYIVYVDQGIKHASRIL